MGLLEILLIVYLSVGLIYGVYLSVKGINSWLMLPINILGGFPVLLYILIMTLLNKRIKIG